MNKHDKQIYREGYNNGKLKAKIIRTTLVQRIPSTDEKEWESKINYFAWAAIICLILFGITAELYALNWNSTRMCKAELDKQQNDTYNCRVTEQQCEVARIRDSISRPIITQIDVGVYAPREYDGCNLVYTGCGQFPGAEFIIDDHCYRCNDYKWGTNIEAKYLIVDDRYIEEK